MDPVRIIEVKRSIFEDNDRDADRLRAELKDKGVFLLNLMSSPGSGKTTTLIQSINLLKEELPKGFMVARYGGDEFLLIGEWDGSFTIESVIKLVEDKLAKVVKEKEIQFDLTVSLGGVVLEAGEKFDLTENLQRADKNMYREKAVHHKSTDGK